VSEAFCGGTPGEVLQLWDSGQDNGDEDRGERTGKELVGSRDAASMMCVGAGWAWSGSRGRKVNFQAEVLAAKELR
jgi:hypothetical protein